MTTSFYVTTLSLSRTPEEKGYRACVAVRETGAVDPVAVATRYAVGDRLEAVRLAQLAVLEAAGLSAEEVSFQAPDHDARLWKEMSARRVELEGSGDPLGEVEGAAWEERRRAVATILDAALEVRARAEKLVARIEREGLEVSVNELGEIQSAAGSVDRACAAAVAAGNAVRVARVVRARRAEKGGSK